jgi:hypothetical protein
MSRVENFRGKLSITPVPEQTVDIEYACRSKTSSFATSLHL